MKDMKAAAAERWVDAVNADGQFGRWTFRLVSKIEAVGATLDSVSAPE